ncbi:unnamed protein product (mitochondrion) [Plasmodiophora brassicae]|nr:unnamed protein product [Plasmodiophora brassicae]
MDVALSESSAPHHKVVIFDLYHYFALRYRDLGFLEMLATDGGQLHMYTLNGLPAVHQAYEIIRVKGLGIGALIDYMSRIPTWTVSLDLSGSTILHAVCYHGTHADIQTVTEFMLRASSLDFETMLLVVNSYGHRADDLVRQRMQMAASVAFVSLLETWSTVTRSSN